MRGREGTLYKVRSTVYGVQSALTRQTSALCYTASMPPNRHRPRLLILGCSTRAAAWSAVRAGFFPVCADEFGDEDLRQVAEVLPIRLDAAAQLEFVTRPTVVAAARLSVTDAMILVNSSENLERYCGPYLGSSGGAAVSANSWLTPLLLARASLPFLENRLCPSSGLGATRLLEQLQELQQQASLELSISEWVPTFADWRDPPTDATWLQKPMRSGGGRGIRHWTFDAAAHPVREPSYFQRYQRGDSLSAVFLARAGAAEPIGVTRQLIGDVTAATPWPFGYCGSVGPIDLPTSGQTMLNRIADALVAGTLLRGLFGIDFIWDGQTPWVVEVNPRYTASCEILELALGRALLTEHWRACLPYGDPPPEPLPVERRCRTAKPVLGKIIVYAREAVTVPDWSRFLKPRSPWSVPFLADVPRVGTRFQPGQPVCTVFASGDDADECYRKLVRRVARVRRWLGERLKEPRTK